MRPFRFFFLLSLGIFFFFFIARFVVMALIVAAVLSFVFYIFRSIKNFFRHLTWENPRDFDYAYERRFESNRFRTPQLEAWKIDFFSPPNERRTYQRQSPKHRVIEII